MLCVNIMGIVREDKGAASAGAPQSCEKGTAVKKHVSFRPRARPARSSICDSKIFEAQVLRIVARAAVAVATTLHFTLQLVNLRLREVGFFCDSKFFGKLASCGTPFSKRSERRRGAIKIYSVGGAVRAHQARISSAA